MTLRTSRMAPQLTVLVGEPDPDRRTRLSAELSAAGFAVLPAANWGTVITALAEGNADMGVLNGSIADLAHLSIDRPGSTQPATVDHRPHDIPWLLTVDRATDLDWAAYARVDTADYVIGRVPPREIVVRLQILAKKVQQRAAVRAAAANLRAGVRAISAQMRSTNDPRLLIEQVLKGVAEVFAVDRVCFTTFHDPRVPRITLDWRAGSATMRPLNLGAMESAVQPLADRMWTEGWVGDIADHDHADVPAEFADLTNWAGGLGARASVSVPVGEGPSAFGLIWLASTGTPREWTSMEISMLQHLAGNLAHGLVQGQLITGQQEVLRRLQQLDSAKSEFLATVNHELRTPLTSLTAYLDLLQDGVAGEMPKKAHDMLAIVGRNAKRLEQLIDDVLTVSKMAANDPEMNWAPVNVSDVVRRAFDGFRAGAEARGVSVSLPPPAGLVVDGDLLQLQRVFRNVADNAVKFTPTGGKVEVTIEEEVDDASRAVAVIRVADTGMGVPTAEIPEMFKNFVRASNARADAVSGSGLGLAIVRGLVDAHGGEVTIGPTPGGGTTVTVRLPVVREVADGDLAPSSGAGGQSGDPGHHAGAPDSSHHGPGNHEWSERVFGTPARADGHN